ASPSLPSKGLDLGRRRHLLGSRLPALAPAPQHEKGSQEDHEEGAGEEQRSVLGAPPVDAAEEIERPLPVDDADERPEPVPQPAGHDQGHHEMGDRELEDAGGETKILNGIGGGSTAGTARASTSQRWKASRARLVRSPPNRRMRIASSPRRPSQ